MNFLNEVATVLFQFYFQVWVLGLLTTFFLPKRKYFWLRFIPLNAAYLTVFTVAYYYDFFGVSSLHIGWLSFGYLIAYAVLLLLLFCCYKVKPVHLLYYGISAYCMQHFIYNADMLFITLTVSAGYFNWTLFLWISALISLIAYVSFYFIFIRRLRRNQVLGLDDKVVICVACVVMAIVYLLSCYSLFAGDQMTISSEIYGICCSLLLLFILFCLYRASEKKLEQEKIEQMLSMEREHQRIMQNDIEYINVKCHDIKHLISVMREGRTKGEIFADYFDNLEKAVNIYDSNLKTGNDALDICLTEKSLQCHKHSIIFSCIADGDKLSMMESTDIYSLFGNALDNAIEALSRVENPSRRLLDVSVRAQDKLLSIHIANYYEDEIEFKDGIPLTRKEDKTVHGYGMKSIRYIVEKYGGTISIIAKDNMFNLNVFIPLRNS